MKRKLLTLLLAVVLTGTAVNIPIDVRAEETVDETGQESGTEETATKELLQHSTEWTVFRYSDENGDPMFEIVYDDKTVEELAEENLSLQYRIIYKNEEEIKLVTSSWHDREDVLSEEEKEDIRENKDKYYIQFQIVDEQQENVSNSDTFLIWQQETPFPYIMSSTVDCYKVYDLRTKPTTMRVMLQISEPLSTTDTLYIDRHCSIASYKLSSEAYAKNISYANFSEDVVLGENSYNVQYSLVKFDLCISSTCYLYDTNDVTVSYKYIFNGLYGMNSGLAPASFMINTITPVYKGPSTVYVSSVNITAPSSEVVVGEQIQLSANVLPENASNKALEWSSSNTDYATVDRNGLVTTKEAGAGKSVVIKAMSTDTSDIVATYTLQIKKPTTEPETPGTQEEPKEPEKAQPVALTTAKVTLSKTSLAYNGKAQKPSVTVTSNGTELKENTDYTVTYKNNKNIGTATVTITGKGNYTGTVKKTFKIVAKKGTTFTVGSYKYKITSTSTVAFAGLKSSKTTKVTIPSTVKIGGTTFKVTSIADKALSKKTKVTSVTIGANVTTIGKEAFNGCKKLGTIAVKSTKLKSVGKNALKEIKSTAKIKVPSKKLSAYKKLLKSKGQGKKVTITK